MNKYVSLETCLLSCLLLKPKLMDNIKLEDKHFIEYKKIWLFMKSFYKKFGNFDLNIMYSVASNKYNFLEYMTWLVDATPNVELFEYYQQQMLDLYNENKKDKYIIEEVYKLANDLFVKNITTNDFKHKVVAIYRNADEIFKKGDDE